MSMQGTVAVKRGAISQPSNMAVYVLYSRWGEHPSAYDSKGTVSLACSCEICQTSSCTHKREGNVVRPMLLRHATIRCAVNNSSFYALSRTNNT